MEGATHHRALEGCNLCVSGVESQIHHEVVIVGRVYTFEYSMESM